MHSRPLRIFLCFAIALAPLSGCRSIHNTSTAIPETTRNVPSPGPSYLEPYEPVICENDSLPPDSLSPDDVLDYHNIEYRPISLEECIQRALADSEVFRDLGGRIVTTPAAVRTALDPALIFTNPRFGEDAALSAFDAVYSQSIFFEKNDRPFNNPFTGDTRGIFQQDFGEFNFQMTKLAATGTRFTSRGIINYDDNSQAGNRFFHTWETILDNEFRHPLLQGSGTFFNRIAGPSQVPGTFNGILIARTNSEIGLAEFQTAARDFIVNVENAYWGLYYAYRELNAQIAARDAAFEVYKTAEAKVQEKRVSTLESASAYEQYLRFETAIVESLEGRPAEGTQSVTPRRNVGVRIAERRLRYLIGMPITDGAMLEPCDQPNTTPVVFDWDESVQSAMHNRPELRRQRWVVKQRELQLIASKNFLLPRLDLVGRYRLRGLGRDLTGGESWQRVIDSDDNNDGVSGAFADLGTLNFQEWQLGVELRTPLGFRQAHAGVRYAELATERARMILDEQERKILLDLSNAVASVRRAWTAMSVASQRYDAATEYRSLAAERIERGRAQFDVLLEAQRRVLESQIQFNTAEVDNAFALRDVHLERGTLLQFHGIAISENESDPGAYDSANRLQSRRKRTLNYILRNPSIARPLNDAGVTVSAGAMLGAAEASTESLSTAANSATRTSVDDTLSDPLPGGEGQARSAAEMAEGSAPADRFAAEVRSAPANSSAVNLHSPTPAVRQNVLVPLNDYEPKTSLSPVTPAAAPQPTVTVSGRVSNLSLSDREAPIPPTPLGAVLPKNEVVRPFSGQPGLVIPKSDSPIPQPVTVGAVQPTPAATYRNPVVPSPPAGIMLPGNPIHPPSATSTFMGAAMPRQASTFPEASSSDYHGAVIPRDVPQYAPSIRPIDRGVALPKGSAEFRRGAGGFQLPGVINPSDQPSRSAAFQPLDEGASPHLLR